MKLGLNWLRSWRSHLQNVIGTHTTKGTEEHGSPLRVKGVKLTNYFRSKLMNTLQLVKNQIKKQSALHDAQINITKYRGVDCKVHQADGETHGTFCYRGRTYTKWLPNQLNSVKMGVSTPIFLWKRINLNRLYPNLNFLLISWNQRFILTQRHTIHLELNMTFPSQIMKKYSMMMMVIKIKQCKKN